MDDYDQPLLSNSEDSSSTISEKDPSSISTLYGHDHDNDIGPINGARDLFGVLFIELNKVLYLAGPMMFISICSYATGILTQIFIGHLGTIQLAAIAVENSAIAGLGLGILMGMASALETLCGQAYGAKHFGMLGIYMQRSWFLLNMATLPIVLIFIFATPILKFLGQDETISKVAGKFALWLIPQQFANALMIPLAKFLQTQSKVVEMAVLTSIGLLLHAFLGWLFILKLGWGLFGAAAMMNASSWFGALAQFLFVISGRCGLAWQGFSWKAFTHLSGFIKLTISSAIMDCLAMWYLMAMTLIAGYLRNAEVSVAALSICLSVTGLSSMVGTGFSIAVSVRVSNELGSGRPRAAKFSVMVVGVTSVLFGVFFALLIFLKRKQYPALYSNDTEVKQLVEELTPLVCISIIFACVPLVGVAVGAGWQTFVARMNVGCYFLFGVPFGVLLCYKYDMGIEGLWYGNILGVSLQNLGLLLVICMTNWKKEAYAALERLEQFGGETQAQNDEER